MIPLWRVCRLSILTVLLLRCSGHTSALPMSEDRFVDLYVRMERLNRRYAASPDSLRAGRTELFRAQGTNQQEIERAILWYRQHPDRGLRALERIAERLEAEDQKEKAEGRGQKAE